MLVHEDYVYGFSVSVIESSIFLLLRDLVVKVFTEVVAVTFGFTQVRSVNGIFLLCVQNLRSTIFRSFLHRNNFLPCQIGIYQI